MRIRIAKPSDSNAIAEIHYASREKLAKGFFSQVTKSFLINYYKVLLNDPNSVVVCAEAKNGVICGFASGTLDAEKQFENLGRHKFRLAIALLPTIFFRPQIIGEALSRYISTRKNNENVDKYVSVTGPRTEYWVWDARYGSSIWAGVLNNAHLHIMLILGVKSVCFEVDQDNHSVVKFSKGNGAEVVEIISLKDGRTRLIMKYDLVKKFGRKSVVR